MSAKVLKAVACRVKATCAPSIMPASLTAQMIGPLGVFAYAVG
jgi:hypothetical protein